MENKRLMKELQTRKMQVGNSEQYRLGEDLTQLQESMERTREKLEQLEESAENTSNCISVCGLACNVAVLEDQSFIERECKMRSGIQNSEDSEVSIGGVCSLSFVRDVTTPWLLG